MTEPTPREEWSERVRACVEVYLSKLDCGRGAAMNHDGRERLGDRSPAATTDEVPGGQTRRSPV